jgi:hypothetical protein
VQQPRDPSEVENDEIHRRIAALMRRDPTIIDVAKARIARWLAGDGAEPHPATVEWQMALEMFRPEDLADFLESPTPRARRMRSSSPFFGLDR